MFLPSTFLLFGWLIPSSGVQDGPPRILGRLYCGNGCTDFNKILHSGRDRQLLIVGGPITRLTNPRWRTGAILENLNTTISPRRMGLSRRNFAGAGWCRQGLRENCRQHFEISKIQDGGRRHLENPLNCDISAAVWPISTKFGTVTCMRTP